MIENIEMNRYSVKLLFQYRVLGVGATIRRLCEERIVCFQATNAKEAIRSARNYGREANFRYENADGNPVNFEFIGVIDMVDLTVVCEDNEVWYDVYQRNTPMERKRKLTLTDAQLMQSLMNPKRETGE